VEAQLETTVRIEAENSGVVTLAPLCNPDVPTVGCWFTETDAKYSGATDTAYLIPGADVATTTVSLDFTGVGIYWIGLTSPNGGLFDFKIDAATNDEVCGRVDTSISAPNVNRCNRILMAKDLTDGPHTLEIKVLGVNALGNDSPDEVYMDAFDVVTVAGDPDPPDPPEATPLLNCTGYGVPPDGLPPVEVLPGSIRHEERHLQLEGPNPPPALNWGDESNGQFSETTAVQSSIQDATASFNFDGTGLYWIGRTIFNGGFGNWVIDEGLGGEVSGQLDTYLVDPPSDGQFFTRCLLADGLADGPHTFTLTVPKDGSGPGAVHEVYIDAFDAICGPSQGCAGTDAPVEIMAQNNNLEDDEFIRYEERHVKLAGGWLYETRPEHSEARAAQSSLDTATVSFDFQGGPELWWMGTTSFNGGLADWVIDEGLPGAINGQLDTNTMGAVNRFDRILLTDQLGNGPHTFKLTVLNQNSGAAGAGGGVGTEVYVDAFDVTKTTPVNLMLYLPGDCNNDGSLDLSDVICLLGHLFQGNPPVLPCNSAAANLTLMDCNNDGGIDLSDAIYKLTYLFGGGPEPVLGVDCIDIDCPANPGCP